MQGDVVRCQVCSCAKRTRACLRARACGPARTRVRVCVGVRACGRSCVHAFCNSCIAGVGFVVFYREGFVLIPASLAPVSTIVMASTVGVSILVCIALLGCGLCEVFIELSAHGRSTTRMSFGRRTYFSRRAEELIRKGFGWLMQVAPLEA